MKIEPSVRRHCLPSFPMTDMYSTEYWCDQKLKGITKKHILFGQIES